MKKMKVLSLEEQRKIRGGAIEKFDDKKTTTTTTTTTSGSTDSSSHAKAQLVDATSIGG